MGLGGTRLARHRQAPSGAARGTGGGTGADVVTAHGVGECVCQAGLDNLLTALLGDGHRLAVAVEDRIDGTRRAPLAVRGESGRDVGEFERVDPGGAEGERTEVLFLLEVGHAALVEARGVGIGVRAHAETDSHVDGRRDAGRLDELDESGVWGLCQGVGHGQRRRIVAGVLHAVRRDRAACRTTATHALGFEALGHVEGRVDAEALLHRRSGREDLEDGTRTVTGKGVRLRLDGFVGVGIESVRATAGHRDDLV